MREHSKQETLLEGGGSFDQSVYSETKALELSEAPRVEGRHLPAVEQSAYSEAKALQWSEGTRVSKVRRVQRKHLPIVEQSAYSGCKCLRWSEGVLLHTVEQSASARTSFTYSVTYFTYSAKEPNIP